MARIFYFTAMGDIYGVHPGAFSGNLPAGVDFIDVPEAPDAIPWPKAASGRSGEKFARVVAGALVADDPETQWNVPLPTFLDRLSDADADAVMTMIEGRPAKLRERLRLRGIPSDNQQVRDWLTANGYDPDVVLAR